MKDIASYFWPQTLEILHSSYNPDAKVIRYMGSVRLLVKGSIQAGPFITNMLLRAMKKFNILERKTLSSFLMLGLGGATTPKLLLDRYPDMHTTIVEIDPEIIRIARKYFDLDMLPHTRIICDDARTFIRSSQGNGKRYDLIQIDLYIGRDVPDFVLSPDFIRGISGLLGPTGELFINYDVDAGYEEKWVKLHSLLTMQFRDVSYIKIEHNILFHARV